MRGKVRPLRHVMRSERGLDLSDPWQRRWYMKQMLVHTRAEGVARLHWEESGRLLPELDLPRGVCPLWENCFNSREKTKC